ncbi:MAG: DUF255 domain-containing protein [Candidatus Omnitrophota bacterium]
MKNILIFAVLLLIISGCAQYQKPVYAGNIDWIKDFTQGAQAAQEQNKPILIDFYTTWCGWCKELDKNTYSDEKVAEFTQKFICIKIDADQYPDLAKEYQVRGFPTTTFLKSDRSLIKSVPGYMPPDKFLKLLKEIFASIK